MIASFVFWAYLPFTGLIHLWSAPLGYLVRPYISMCGYESIDSEMRTSEREYGQRHSLAARVSKGIRTDR